ncbi:secretion-regulating guanine nucleotide exchange factor [Anopheles nili]|uniref:secretion-regulating guanine nucleotide exchange factor n=1 Tax=Anopheles nili TaxID=185578 RepID=UPI00237BF295|nr:secretion-regulating guanine nucleotide exchange factor [Anopheles nili]
MFAWGANSHGQLGLGYATEQCDRPRLVGDLPFGTSDILCLAAGGGHTLLGTVDGRLYACGWNNRGQLGTGHEIDCFQFQHIGVYGFKQLFAGWDVSAGIDAFGQLYVWGSNVWKQLAESGEKNISTPTRLILPDGGRAVKVTFGLQYTVVLMDNGKIWVMGKCKFLPSNLLPSHSGIRCLREGDDSVLDIASGDHHLVLVTGNRRIECVGDNKHGQCLSENVFPEDIVKLESGWTHSGCLTACSKVYLWGRNNYGQLGFSGESSSSPRLLEIVAKDDLAVKDFSLGSQHGVALTVTGQVYCWGWNEHGNCGTGGVDNVLVPMLVDLPLSISKAICGAGYTLAIT